MLDFAIEKGIVKINVARTVNTSKFSFAAEKDNSNAVYTPEDRDVLIKYVKSLPQSRYTLAIRLMACFPLRMGELRALTWEDYDVKNKKLLIHHEIVKEARDGKNRCDLDVPFVKGAKDSGVRKLPVSSEAAKIFELLREINGSKKYILNGERNAMFSLPENRINEHLRTYCNECGINYYPSHQFRFYGATQLYRAGVPLATISYYLGHSNLKTTIHYLRLTPEDASNEIIESIFG